MSTSKEQTPEKLDMDSLDQVVGGIAAPAVRKTDLADTIGIARTGLPLNENPFAGIVIGRPGTPEMPKVFETPKNDLDFTRSSLVNNFDNATSGGKTAAQAIETLVRNGTTTLLSTGMSAADSRAVVLASLYDELSGGKLANKAGAEQVKAALATSREEIVCGVGLSVGAGASLGDTMTRGMNTVADLAKGIAPNERDAVVKKATEAFENGLERAKGTRIGKAVLGVIDDPKSVEAWKSLIAEKAIGYVLPSTKPLTMLCSLVETGAVAKLWGGSDVPAEAKQVARTISGAVSDLKDTIAEVYKIGYLGAIENVGGLFIHGAVNLANMKSALMSGDPNQMKDAAGKLALGVVMDLKDIGKAYYVDAPMALYKMSSKMVMNIMDGLGATQYANVAANACKTALTDFGNDAARGITGAANAVADLARMGVPGAVNELGSIAGKANAAIAGAATAALSEIGKGTTAAAGAAVSELSGLARGATGAVAGAATAALADIGKGTTAAAEKAVGELSNVARAGGQTAEAAVRGLQDAAKLGGRAADQAVAGLGDVARGTGAAAQAAVGALEDVGRMGNRYAAKAVDELAGLGRKGLGAIENLGSRGVEVAQDVVNKIGNFVKNLFGGGSSGPKSVAMTLDQALDMAVKGNTQALAAVRNMAAGDAKVSVYAAEMMRDIVRRAGQSEAGARPGVAVLADLARAEIARGGKTEEQCPAWYTLGWLANIGQNEAQQALRTITPPRV